MGTLCQHITVVIFTRTYQVLDYCQYLAVLAVSSDETIMYYDRNLATFYGNMLPSSSVFSEISINFDWITCHHIPEDIFIVTGMRTSYLTFPYFIVCTFQLQFHDLFTVLYSHLQVD